MDLLAHEYGWAKENILNNVYLDELFNLVRKINARKFADYKMQLAIVQNPYTKNPKELWNILKDQERDDNDMAEEFDTTGFELLKQRMSDNPRIVIKGGD